MVATTLQGFLNNLSVGQVVDVPLSDHMSVPGDEISIVGSSALLAESDLIPGLSIDSVGRLTGTVTGAGLRILKARAKKGTFDAEADWVARTAGATAFHKIDSLQDVTDSQQSPVGGNHNGDGGWDFWHNFDATTKVYGNGSLLLRHPPGSIVLSSQAEMRSGFHTKNVAWNTADSGWGIGDSFYTCFSMRTDRNCVKYLGDQFGPNPKIALWDMRVGFTNPNTNEWETVIHHEDGGNIGGYLNVQGGANGQQWEEGKVTSYTASDIADTPDVDNGENQLNGVDPGLTTGNGAGSDWTTWQQERYRYGSLYSYRVLDSARDNHPDPIHGGLKSPIDDWVHFKIKHTIGTPGVADSRQETWYAHHGQDWVLYNDKTYEMSVDGSGPNYFQGAGGAGQAQSTTFETLWFNWLAFGAGSDASRPERQRWYDGIITSVNDIAAPGFSAGTGNYRTADAIVTMRAT